MFKLFKPFNPRDAGEETGGGDELQTVPTIGECCSSPMLRE
jgi:hypothetical protein